MEFPEGASGATGSGFTAANGGAGDVRGDGLYCGPALSDPGRLPALRQAPILDWSDERGWPDPASAPVCGGAFRGGLVHDLGDRGSQCEHGCAGVAEEGGPVDVGVRADAACDAFHRAHEFVRSGV